MGLEVDRNLNFTPTSKAPVDPRDIELSVMEFRITCPTSRSQRCAIKVYNTQIEKVVNMQGTDATDTGSLREAIN